MQATDVLLYAGIAMYPVFFAVERLRPARPLPPVAGWDLLGVLFFSVYVAVGIWLPGALPASWYERSLLPGSKLGLEGTLLLTRSLGLHFDVKGGGPGWYGGLTLLYVPL